MQVWTDEKSIKTCYLKKLHNSIEKIKDPIENHVIFFWFNSRPMEKLDIDFIPSSAKKIQHPSHLCCWLLFESACRILRSPVSSKKDVKNADDCLVLFLRMAKSLYEPKYFTLICIYIFT